MKEEVKEISNGKLLLAEDDKNLGAVLQAYLKAKNFECDRCLNGKEAVDAFKVHRDYDLIIMDVMMPIMDGFSAAEIIRNYTDKVPIMFLTAKSLPEDIVKGFDLGGDDYVTKPFHMEELLARIESILRRTKVREEEDRVEFFEIGKYTFDVVRQVLSFQGEDRKLTSKETDLLEQLCIYKNKTLERAEALKRIWKNDSYFNARSMDVYVTKLRKYLKKDETVEILNVHGVGFRLIVMEDEK